MDSAPLYFEAVLSLLLLAVSSVFWLAAWISFFIIPSGRRFNFSLFFLHLPVILLLGLLILCYTTNITDHPFFRSGNVYCWLACVLSLPSIYYAIPFFRSGDIPDKGQTLFLIAGSVCTLAFTWGISPFFKTFAV
ncbi:MAG: hypothetical protein IJS14_08910 [Lentisphaeria bacterium]|nr:hypothetical protein [Lentisphaeria bacterium]